MQNSPPSTPSPNPTAPSSRFHQFYQDHTRKQKHPTNIATIPCNRCTESQYWKPINPKIVQEKATILIVDRYSDHLLELNDSLRAEGHTVILSSNGEDVLSSPEPRVPDLVLASVEMLAKDHCGLLGRFKENRFFAPVPLLAIANENELQSVIACIQSGAEDYLVRPVDPLEVNQRIETILTNRSARPPTVKLGAYNIIRKIGAGGMADVYLAHHAMLRRPAAIKILRENESRTLSMEMFEHEVQLTSALSHPNTISIFDFGCTPDGLFYYVMEYLDGIDLSTLVRLDLPIPEARVINIMRQVCASLAEAHHYGIVHGDIKPQNIFLCERGGQFDFAKVLDFGVAKTFNERGDPTASHASPLFISPEAATLEQQVDGRSDLYSLGAVGYYLLTGQFVFDSGNQDELLDAHLEQIPVPPSSRSKRKISPDLEALIMLCLEKKMENRPDGAHRLEQLLARCGEAGKWTPEHAKEWWIDYLKQQWPRHLAAEETHPPGKSDRLPPASEFQRKLRLRSIAARLAPSKAS